MPGIYFGGPSMDSHGADRSGQPMITSRRIGRMVAASAVICYLAVSLTWLDRFPIVGQDEPWIAAPGYKLATQGILGSDLFTGYHGMERHHMVHMPLYAVVQGAVFAAFGAGVVQMRILSVAFGLALLLLVYAVARAIRDERVATLAVVLMVVQSLATPTEIRPIGILLLDDARINRYDIAVPAFGLAAFLVTLATATCPRGWRYALAGSLAGLAGLSHLYGAFWLPSLAVLLVVRDGLHRAALRSVSLLVAGFALTWLPWAIWIAANWADYVAQMRTVGARLDVFSLAFYLENVITSDGPISLGWLWRQVATLPFDRVGAWFVAFGVPAAALAMGRGPRSRASGERALLVVGIVQCVLYVTLLRVKSYNYVIALWPLAVLSLAWLAVDWWDRRRPMARMALVVLGAAILVEGGTRLSSAAGRARHTSSYDWYTGQIAACIPPGALVLGFQHYWLGLRQFPYRTWLLPFSLANPDYQAAPVPLDVALDGIDPDIVLIDRHARALFDETRDPAHRYHQLSVGFEAFRTRRRLLGRCEVHDPSYGAMEVYEVALRTGR